MNLHTSLDYITIIPKCSTNFTGINEVTLYTVTYFQKTLKDFDNLTTQLISQAEKETTPQQEVQQMYARLELKEKQLQELADAMKKYSPSEELYKQYQEEARLAMEEANYFKNDVMKQMQEELERRKAEEKRREEERKRALLEKLR